MPQRPKFFAFHALRYVAMGLIALAVVAIGLTLWALRSDAIESARRDVTNIALILANQINRSVRDIEMILDEFRYRAAHEAIATPHQFREVFGASTPSQLTGEYLSRLPQARIITVIDSEGHAVNSTLAGVTRGMDFSDRDYFQYLSTHDDPGLFVSVPVAGRVRGIWTIFFSKRINGLFGEFIGLVTIGVEVEYFQRSYESIGSLAGQWLLLLRRDGTILLRYPAGNASPGKKMPLGSPWYDKVAEGGGFFRSPGYFGNDGARLAAVRPLRDASLVVNVGMSESAALATWERRAMLIGFGTVLAAICSLLLIRALSTQFRQLAESKVSLTEREARLAESRRELENSNIQLDAALNNMSQGVCMFDRDQRLVVFNARYAAMYGLPDGAIRPGSTLAEVLAARAAAGTVNADPVPFAASVKAQVDQGRQSQYTIELPDGRIVTICNQPMANGGWVATHEDVTERLRSEARIAHMARYDALTDLPNRVLLRERLDEVLVGLARTGRGFALFIFDLDLFKAVNDSLGHPVGDALLQEIALRLEHLVGTHHSVGRLGGDEFAIIQSADGDQRAAAAEMAERLLAAITAPYEIDGHRIVIGISIGIALAPDDGGDASQLLKNADLALYRAKSQGRNGYRFFQSDMDQDARMQRALEIDLRNALARDEFELHYQLILDIATREPCGAEALVRWRHPQHGLIAPDRFIPLAEDIGVIVPLGEWILRQACRDAAAWPMPIKLAVNLSPVQFRSPRLTEAVGEALAVSGLGPERLELEITESVLLQKDADNIGVLHGLGALGVGIVLDDFGTGYSSLSYLRLFKFSKIKIDKSFVAELSHRSDCAAIVVAATNLAHSLGIATTAEGVETWEQFELLRAAGCTQVQGYLFSRPGPADALAFDARAEAPRDQVA